MHGFFEIYPETQSIGFFSSHKVRHYQRLFPNFLPGMASYKLG